MKKNITILTKSSKNKKYCVAGVDDNGNLVRLVTNDEKSYGALSDSDLKYEDGSNVQILDYVQVIGEEKPVGIQTENFLIDEKSKMEKLGTKALIESLSKYQLNSSGNIFGNISYKLNPDEANNLNRSLEIIKFSNGNVRHLIQDGKDKYKFDFYYNGYKHENYSITDSTCYNKRSYPIDNGIIVVSLADDDWARDNGYFKFVAKIFEL